MDSIDIEVPGIGAHGASPHRGIDPVVVACKQSSRSNYRCERTVPREPGVVTVGVFKAGNKRVSLVNPQRLNSRSDLIEGNSPEIDCAIERIAVNIGRAAGLPEDRLPVVSLVGGVPVTAMARTRRRVTAAWDASLGSGYNDL